MDWATDRLQTNRVNRVLAAKRASMLGFWTWAPGSRRVALRPAAVVVASEPLLDPSLLDPVPPLLVQYPLG
jgi:hypothetical protein